MPWNKDGSRKAFYKKSGFKMKGWSAFTQVEDPTKRYTVKKTYVPDETSTSGGYEQTEFGKGGREGDKVHKSITLTKRGAGDEGGAPTYIQTKSRKGKKDKTKVISERKYRRKLARKTARSIRRGHDTENINV